MTVDLAVRPAVRNDAAAMAAIYNEGIRGRGATFETHERTPEEVAAWLDDPRYPVLVAVRHDRIVGWASASRYRARACYDGIAECSLYVTAAARGTGIGTALMTTLVTALEQAGFWKMLSRVFPENTASRRLCARTGFREVGVYRRHGRLDGQWRDVVIVERLIGAARDDAPA